MALTLYAIVQASATTAPSAAQIVAGQDGSGSSAPWSDSKTVSASVDDTSFTVSGLSSSTSYQAYFVWDDGTSDYSNVLSGGVFTTTETPVIPWYDVTEATFSTTKHRAAGTTVVYTAASTTTKLRVDSEATQP
jgi:hypothetical protein